MNVGATVTREALLEVLDRTVSDHLEWLKTWHGGVMLGGGDPAAVDPHHLCLFGTWYVRNQHAELVNQPMLTRLATLHDEMHDRAQT